MKSWLRKFALACGTISLTGANSFAQTRPAGKPAIALLDAGDAPQWQTWVKDLGWPVIAPPAAAQTAIDARIHALEDAVQAAIQNGSADAARIYLAGRGDAGAGVFYTVSRLPDVWAAAVAVGGSPQPAIDGGGLYAANFSHVPVLWAGAGADDRGIAESLQAAGVPLEFRPAEGLTAGAVVEWLAQHHRPPDPEAIDCETSSPEFARCYWIRMMKFDPGERNDVLDSTRMQPRITSALDLGGFGFQKDDPGPGVLVSYLPPKYSGPLKMGDRIVALDGRDIPDARRYIELMAQISEERPAAVMVQRGKEKIRIETRIVLPKPAPGVTARVQGRFLREEKEIQIISRTVTEMRVDIPPQWTPAILNWNGVPLENVEAAGCRLLTIAKAIEKAAPCPQ